MAAIAHPSAAGGLTRVASPLTFESMHHPLHRRLSWFSRLAPLAFALGCGAAGSDLTVSPPPATPAAKAATPLPIPPPQKNGRLPSSAEPLSYAVDLTVDPAKERFAGSVRIKVNLKNQASAVVMHGRDLAISRAEIVAGGAAHKAATMVRHASGSQESPDELVLSVPEILPAGQAEIQIDYTASLDQKLVGLYRVEEGGRHYAFTQFEPLDARRMMPCFDEPGFKVPFDISVTVPKGQLAVSNMPETARTKTQDGQGEKFQFATTPPLPTYLVALAAGPLELREGRASPVPIRLISAQGRSKDGTLALEAAAAHLDLLARWFDVPYPYPKLDLVAVPDFGPGAMENPGLVTFRDELLLVTPENSGVSRQRAMAEVMAHELAHQWFGNLVTMEWWDDIWLNEGFATWMEAKIADQWKPSFKAELEAQSALGFLMSEDALESVRAVRQPIEKPGDIHGAFDGITYGKGAAVINMLENWIGEEAFQRGVRAYIKSHTQKNATAADLFSALKEVSGKDAAYVARGFVDQSGVPLVHAELVCEKGKTPRVKLRHERFRPKPSSAEPANAAHSEAQKRWVIPVCVSFEGQKSNAPACTLLEKETGEVLLSSGAPEGAKTETACPSWIYPNAGEAGYYRIALPKEHFLGLMQAQDKLSPQSRANLLSHAGALVENGLLGADSLIDMTLALKGNRERLVFEKVLFTLGSLEHAYVDDAATRTAFYAHASSILLPLAKELGWEAKKDEPEDRKMLRQRVLGALSAFGEDAWLYTEGEKKAAAVLKDPASADWELAPLALRISARKGDAARFKDYLETAKKTPRVELRKALLSSLGQFKSPELVERGLDLMLSNDLKTEEILHVYFSAFDRRENQPALISWTKKHLGELKAKLPGPMTAAFAWLGALPCEKDVRNDVAGFLKGALVDVESADRSLAQALERSAQCIELRSRQGEIFKARLLGKTKSVKR